MGHLGAVDANSDDTGSHGDARMIWTLLTPLLLASPAPAGALATVGEALPGAVVEAVEIHPEYERYALRYADGSLVPAEVARSREGYPGFCRANGLTLYARAELAEGPVPADLAPPMDALCARLAERPPTLRETVGEAPPSPARRATPLLAVALAWVLAAGWAAARGLRALPRAERAELFAVAAVGIVARLAFSPTGIWNGAGAAYEKLAFAWGTSEVCPYGDGWAALMGPLVALFGRAPDVVFGAVRVWACLAPPALWAVGRLAGGRAVALGAGLALAVLPLHVAMSGSEAMHVVVLALELVAVAAALGGAGWLAALSAGLAAHTRPEALAFAALPLLLLGARRAWGPAALLLALVGWRVATLPPSQDVVPLARYLDVHGWLRHLLPRLGAPVNEASFSVFWHAAFTPPVLWAFALAGLALAPGRVRLLAIAWWLVAEVPIAPKSFPLADAWRLQLVAQPAWLLLVGCGVAALADRIAAARGARWGAVVPWGLAALVALALPGAAPRWAHHREFAFLAEHVPTLHDDDTVWSVEGGSRAARFRDVMAAMGPARWVPAGEGGPTVIYRGLACAAPEACAPLDRCRTSPLAETRIGPPTDLDVTLPAEGVVVGLYRVEGCGP